MKRVVDNRINRLKHVALTGMAFPDPVAQRTRLSGTTTNMIQRDRPQQFVIFAPHDEQGQRGFVFNRACGPIDPVR